MADSHALVIRDEVVVRQHHALGRAGGAGGVDEGKQVVGRDGGFAFFEGGGVGVLLALGHQLAQVRDAGYFLEGVDRQAGAAGFAELVADFLRRGDGEFDARIAQDVSVVVDGDGGVHRHRGSAGLLNAEIGEHPFGPRERDDGDLIAGLNAAPQQAVGYLIDAVDDFLGAPFVPSEVFLPGQGIGFGVLSELVRQDVEGAGDVHEAEQVWGLGSKDTRNGGCGGREREREDRIPPPEWGEVPRSGGGGG